MSKCVFPEVIFTFHIINSWRNFQKVLIGESIMNECYYLIYKNIKSFKNRKKIKKNINFKNRNMIN